MTEVEWLAATDPPAMLSHLRGRASDRKLRMFAAACCRRVWNSLKQEQFRNAVRAAERFADEEITKEAMGEARNTALSVFVQLSGGEDEAPAAAISAAGLPAPKKSYLHQLLDAFDDPWWEYEFDKGDPHAPALVTARHAAWAAAHARGQPLNNAPAKSAEEQEQAIILRDVLGNPFRPVSINPAWLGWNAGTIPRLAQSIYADRAFDRLPILADALEEAGCDDVAILSHCRGPGPHVRGCWVIDLLLGKE